MDVLKPNSLLSAFLDLVQAYSPTNHRQLLGSDSSFIDVDSRSSKFDFS
jgi:hypothetical protein